MSQPGPIVSLAQQAQYLRYVLDSSRTSSVVQRVFIYMVSDTGSDGMNIYPPTGPLPSYAMLETYIAQYPTWSGSAPVPLPSPTPTPAPTPAPTPSATPAPATTQVDTVVSAAQAVAYAPPNKSNSCRRGTVTATGSFTTNGAGGPVLYQWVRTSNGNTVTIAEPPINLAVGDTTIHSVLADTWNPNASGKEQLVFLSPGAPQLAAQTFSCR